MHTIFSDVQLRHRPEGEFNRGAVVPPFEKPQRAEWIRDAVQASGLGPILPPDAFGLEPILRVHDAGYVDFLATAYDEWHAMGRPGAAVPMAWPVRGLRSDRVPASLDGRLGYYSYDVSTPIAADTWDAVRAGADIALTAAQRVRQGERAAFALCRPPGHHAARDYLGGYCYFNNAAIAAQYLRDQGAARVAILDVDYHHGNGTQALFYDRPDVLFVSLHGDPATEYPYYLGYADEIGHGAGEGFNLNLPMPHGTSWETWASALEEGARAVGKFSPDVLVVSLGVDTFEHDPISNFRLRAEHFPLIGQRIQAMGLPTVFIMEGGYAVDEIGRNVASVLTGFEGA